VIPSPVLTETRPAEVVVAKGILAWGRVMLTLALVSPIFAVVE